MKENPENKLIRERLQPGVVSIAGFLGNDKRPIQEIIAEDVAKVAVAGLTTQELGQFLEEIHHAADEGWESYVSLYDGKIKVKSLEVNGKICCPFGCGSCSHKAIIEVKMGDAVILFTPLDAHMINAHGFFEGKGSEYRLEPSEILKLYFYCKNE